MDGWTRQNGAIGVDRFRSNDREFVTVGMVGLSFDVTMFLLVSEVSRNFLIYSKATDCKWR